jgi:riboflavin biosynthesis pyrimidine reductase
MSEVEPFAQLSAEPEPGLALPSELRRVYGGDLGLPERCLYANFVQTVDGVVAIPSIPDSNRLVSGDSAADRFVMGLLRSAADIVLIGSGTLRASARGRWRPETVFPAAAAAYAELRRELGLEKAPRVAILAASGSIPPDRAVLEDGPIVLTTAAGAERLAGTLPAGVEIVTLPGEAEVDVTAAVELLRERGYRRILSEAGPHVFGSLVEAGLVDELFLTVSPLLAGRPSSGSFGLVEGAALLPDHARTARLRSARAHGSHLFLQYALR